MFERRAFFALTCCFALLVSCIECGQAVPNAPAPANGDWIANYQDGCRALEQGDLERAERLLASASAQEPRHVSSEYQLACVAARGGKIDVAFSHLAAAKARGFRDGALLLWDEDLAALRSDPRFAGLRTDLGSSAHSSAGSHSIGDLAFFTRGVESGASSAPKPPWLGANEIVLHPTAPRAYIACTDGSVREVDLTTGATRRELRAAGPPAIVQLEIQDDGARLFAIDLNGILINFDLGTGALSRIASTSEADGRLSWAGFRGDAETLVAQRQDGSIAFLDAATMSLRSSSRPLPVGPSALCASPNFSICAHSVEGGKVEMFEMPSGKPSGREFHVDGEIGALTIEGRGQRLFVGTNRSKIHVFDLRTDALVKILDVQDLDPFGMVEMSDLALSPDGALVVSASYGVATIAAFDTRTLERKWHFEGTSGNESGVRVRFDPTGRWVYAWGQGPGSAHLFDAITGKVVDGCEGNDGRRATIVMPIASTNLALALTNRGMEVVDRVTGALRFSRSETANGGFLLCSPNFYFTGAREAIEAAFLVVDDKTTPLTALAHLLLDVKKVRASAAGIAILPPRGE